MKLSFRGEYALLALAHLARDVSGRPVSVRAIAQAQDIPRKYLEQILLSLKRAGYLHSVQGQHGGYSLAKPPERITLAEIIRLFDGPLAPTSSASVFFYAPSPIEKNARLLSVFQEIRDQVAALLERLTLADL